MMSGGELTHLLVHSENWFSTYKPFGWEVLDLRYGGLQSRLETMHDRLIAYLDVDNSSVTKLEELEVELEVRPDSRGRSGAPFRNLLWPFPDARCPFAGHLSEPGVLPHARLRSLQSAAVRVTQSNRLPPDPARTTTCKTPLCLFAHALCSRILFHVTIP
jgi:hypothetical protein